MTQKFKYQDLTAEQTAWLAGLFQAEGYFHYDKRVRAKTPGYTPPPPIPQIKIEMIEQDLMETVGEYLGKDVITNKRKTSANNTVYKITLYAREEVEAFLLAIRPYVIGNKTCSKIDEMLVVCNDYNAWKAAGGSTEAAKIANKASQKAKRQNNKE